MAHFAEIDEVGRVLRVLVIADEDCLDADGKESEEVGAEFCATNFGGQWIQTSYNSKIRGMFAGIDYWYSKEYDVFTLWSQPYPSWVWDSDLNQWEAPVEMPSEGGPYLWNEEKLAWEPVPNLETDEE